MVFDFYALSSYDTAMDLEKLKEDLKTAGYTQEDLAFDYGVNQSHISRVLNGEKRLYLELLEFFAKKLEHHPAALLLTDPLDQKLCDLTLGLPHQEKKDILNYLVTRKLIDKSNQNT